MTIPTLTVDNGFTMSAGNFLADGTGTFQTTAGANTMRGNVAISADTFSTGTGDVSLNGNVVIADSKTFTVGRSNGAGGASEFKGTVAIGQNVNSMSKTLTVYGDVSLHDDADATAKTFSTGSGDVSLKGHTAIASGKNLHMDSGSGTFQTGSGDVSLNGDVTIHASKNFESGQGNVVLNANVWIADGKLLTVGAATTGAASASNTVIYGALTVGAGGASQATSLTVHGHLTQNDDGDGTLKTFTTGGGAISLNGNVDIAANKHLKQASGTGSFQTGTGSVTLNGDTEVTAAKTFTTGTGLVSLKGTTTVVEPANFQVGTQGTSSPTSVATFYGNVFMGGPGKFESKHLVVNGHIHQNDDLDSSIKTTFVTGAGGMSLNGNVLIAAGQHLEMASGAGKFTSGTGNILLNGHTQIGSSAFPGRTLNVDGTTYENIKCNQSNGLSTNTYCTAQR
jgi:hypothetical protein